MFFRELFSTFRSLPCPSGAQKHKQISVRGQNIRAARSLRPLGYGLVYPNNMLPKSKQMFCVTLNITETSHVVLWLFFSVFSTSYGFVHYHFTLVFPEASEAVMCIFWFHLKISRPDTQWVEEVF